uniref:Uncharacterized protein LOC113787214 n=1 Tax=Cicer arietinum TaxID=3827 RepID=A0A3Q7YD19_CICAR|nr:uncharacterized protein LOC113787214 [Cicer arietinum]
MDPMELERVNESSGIEGTSSNDNLTRLSDEGAVEMTMSRNRIRDRIGLLPPYRGERYHAQEYRGQGRQPRSPEELFNYRHSSLRMTIERCFGVLKNRFPILKLMPPYKPSRQRLIVIACCTIHNYIRKWNLPDELFNIWEAMDPMELERVNESSGIEGTSSNDNLTRLSDEGAVEMTMSRNRIRDRMWVHHHN